MKRSSRTACQKSTRSMGYRLLAKVRHLAWLTCAILAIQVLQPAQAGETVQLTILTGTPETFPTTKLLRDVFIPEVDRRLAAQGNDYQIRWKTVFGTVAKTADTLEALEAGIGDIGVVIPPFDPSKLSLYLVTYVAPFTARDPDMVEAAIGDVYEQVPGFTLQWDTYDLIPLTTAVSDSYQLFTTKPIRTLEDLDGLKIASPSSAATWLSGTGAVHVQDESANYYNSVKTGVYDGFLFLVDLAYVLRLYEAAPYITQVDFGPMYLGGVVVNKRRWDKLPQPVRDAIREAAEVYDARARALQETLYQRAVSGLEAAGIEIFRLPAEERTKWAQRIPDIASLWAARLERYDLPGSDVLRVYMNGLRRRGADIARDWDDQP